MNTRSQNLPLEDFDPEIEATLHLNNNKKREATLDTMAATAEEVRALREQLQALLDAQKDTGAQKHSPINEAFTPQYYFHEPPRVNANNFELKTGLITMEGAKTAKDESARLIENKSEEVTVEVSGRKKEEKQKATSPATVTIPFPQRQKKERMKERLSKFLEIFKKVNINIPLVEMLLEMPQCAKFLKDIVSRKKKLGEFETQFRRSLCDLGASINLMPLSVFKQLAIGELKPTSMRLQMADKSVT
ncbi:uncharacterized protein LOC131008258 [Salvia miltiorrhiza]|uniref:uncharacterized protein LOC131008258 n=1 Tax=Salvia miltiorrhiza TaxID=226208 RepID=UPI0025ABB346|nr:uncharacterized protein LOC131008258 [Salvia miltiorrhiza]